MKTVKKTKLERLADEGQITEVASEQTKAEP